MTDYRVEKRRAEAEVTLATGAVIKGFFFLSPTSPRRAGPERIAELLNAEPGFFPFELRDKSTALFNRAHVVLISLPNNAVEAQSEPGYDVARRRAVSMLLTTGQSLTGTISIYRPAGRDRTSDYTRSPERFRYLETSDGTVIVNFAHIVELREPEAGTPQARQGAAT